MSKIRPVRSTRKSMPCWRFFTELDDAFEVADWAGLEFLAEVDGKLYRVAPGGVCEDMQGRLPVLEELLERM